MRQLRVGSLAVRESGDPAEPGVLLWPGLGATGAYFAPLMEALPGRAVAVDPPGLGDSARLEPCTFERLVETARAVVEKCECRAVVGHSLGAFVAVGLASMPDAALEAAVLIDGGFMQAQDMAALGMPVTAGRARLVEWLAANSLRFADWPTVTRELATMSSSPESPALQAYVRQIFIERDGEIRERMTPEEAADLLLATYGHGLTSAEALSVPTLLIACGQPAERRSHRERAWRAFAAESSLITLHVEEGWGHNAIFQDPDGLRSLIAGWLRQHL